MGSILQIIIEISGKSISFVIFIGAAILTPPDVFTQTLMAGPLIILYEISILVSQMAGKKEKVPAPEEQKTQDKKSKS